MKKLTIFLIGLIAFLGVGYTYMSTSVAAFTPFFNGFESDTDGWFDFGGTVVRTASNTDGYPSSDGDYHAVIDGGVFTRWGGYESIFPTNGFVTEVDVYLDMSEALGDDVDKRFDYTVAATNQADNHLQDFIFHLGTNPATAGEWFVSVSNNAPGWPGNPGRSPIIIDESGWYTLRHTFMDDGTGVLAVMMEIVDDTGTVLGDWTLSDPGNLISTVVGGNRYGWFIIDAAATYGQTYSFDRFDSIAIDNSAKYEVVVDEEGPVVAIDSPADGAVVSGILDIYGSVTDNVELSHYNLSLYPSTTDLSDGGTHSADRLNDPRWCTVPISGTVSLSDDFTGSFCTGWDTTAYPDGEYQIRLAARDAEGNRDLSDPYTGDTSSVHVVMITINNTPDDKDQCKKGGWESFFSPMFKNQGDCVSFVQSNENARGNKEK